MSADDLAGSVIYVRHPEDFEQSPLFNMLLRSDDISAVTIVVDDCPATNRASIWNALRQRSNRIRLITLDHSEDTSTDEWMTVLRCPGLEGDQIRAILGEYIRNEHDSHRWISFCSGSPRVAHAVGENLQRNPQDILKEPSVVPVWERYIHGKSRSGSEEEIQNETVLRYIALFHKFGFERPVEGEAQFVATLVAEANPSVTWARFQSIIKHYRDRRIIQGRTTLFLVPRALHVHLWVQFWEHYGRGLDVPVLLARMPNSLFRWFSEMFKYGHASPSCMACIEHLTSPGGLFDDSRFITTGPGAMFINELAEAHPQATLNCIERSVGSWSKEDLLQFRDGRQYVVWALQKIAVWKELFRRAAAVLLTLAIAENGSNANNATGTFCGLFNLGYGPMATTEAPPEARLSTLRTALGSPQPEIRQIALKAAAQALAERFTKISGPEHQGIRPLPDLWQPKTYGEVFGAYRAMWQLLTNFRRGARDADKTSATTILVDAAHSLVRARWIDTDVINTLTEIAHDSTTDLRQVVQFITRVRRFNWHGVSRKAAQELRLLDKRIAGTSVESQVRRLVLFGNSDDIDRPRKGPYGKKHIRELRKLASLALSDEVLDGLLPDLFSQPGFALLGFGRALAEMAGDRELFPMLLTHFVAAGEERNPLLLAGFLSWWYQNDPARWEALALQLLNDEQMASHLNTLVVRSGMTEKVLDQICDLVVSNKVPPTTLSGIGYSVRHHGMNIGRCLEFIAWCSQGGIVELVRIGIETAHIIFCVDKDALSLPEEPLLTLLTAPDVLVIGRRNDPDYEWAELVQKYIRVYPQHATRLLTSIFENFDQWELVLELKRPHAAYAAICALITVDVHAAWNVVSRYLSTSARDKSRHIMLWLGPPHTFGDGSGIGPEL